MGIPLRYKLLNILYYTICCIVGGPSGTRTLDTLIKSPQNNRKVLYFLILTYYLTNFVLCIILLITLQPIVYVAVDILQFLFGVLALVEYCGGFVGFGCFNVLVVTPNDLLIVLNKPIYS